MGTFSAPYIERWLSCPGGGKPIASKGLVSVNCPKCGRKLKLTFYSGGKARVPIHKVVTT